VTAAALELFGERKTGLIFGKMHHGALLNKLHALRPDVEAVVHGFRTSFTSWARNAGYPKALRELAKAHAAGKIAMASDGEAYERAEDINEERDAQLKTLRPMMQAWSDYAMSQVQ
jgi:hypothetical protein